ncbi:MAG: CoA-binding protein [Anaerolineae bacterium]|nr:MAG: CoA-binding protein [Anaerolineae bacterium]
MTNPPDSALKDLLTNARVIAVVGHSDNPDRTSYQIAQYLRAAGYTVYPVNPAVETIDGQPSYPSLAAVPEPIDIVDVFRRSEFLSGVVEEAIAAGAKSVWAQLGVADEVAAETARRAGLTMVMDSCIKVDHMRLRVGRAN